MAEKETPSLLSMGNQGSQTGEPILMDPWKFSKPAKKVMEWYMNKSPYGMNLGFGGGKYFIPFKTPLNAANQYAQVGRGIPMYSPQQASPNWMGAAGMGLSAASTFMPYLFPKAESKS